MGFKVVAEPVYCNRGPTTNSFVRRACPTKIHTIHDFQQARPGQLREIAELIAQTTALMDSTQIAVDRYSDSVASNDETLCSLASRIQTQADGQAELALKIKATDKKFSETSRRILEAKKAGWHALVAVGTLGVSSALKPMLESSRSEQGSSVQQSRKSQRDPYPNAGPHQSPRSGRVLVADVNPSEMGPSFWPPRNAADWERLVSEAEQQNGGAGGPITPWLPLESPEVFPQPSFSNKSSFIRLASAQLACAHNDRGDTSLMDIAEHLGNGEYGSAARDVIEAEATKDCLKTIGEQIIRNESDWNDRDWGVYGGHNIND